MPRPWVIVFALVGLFIASSLVDEALASEPERKQTAAQVLPACKPGEILISAPDGIVKIPPTCAKISWPKKPGVNTKGIFDAVDKAVEKIKRKPKKASRWQEKPALRWDFESRRVMLARYP